MSLIASARATVSRTKGKHRGKSTAQLHKEIDSRECEVVRLNLLLDELGGAYLNLQATRRNEVSNLETALEAARQATTAANERARLLDGALAEAKAEIRRLQAANTALRATVQPRDTSRLEDQPTHPIDVRQLRDDYLNTGWKLPAGPIIPVPLPEAPFAMDRPPSSPTDLPGETTLTLRLRAA